MQRTVVLLLAVSLSAACARSKYTKAPTVPTDDPAFSAPEKIVMRGVDSDPPEPLKLFPGDIVQLTTLSSETLVYEGLIVDARGQLHVPLAGDIQVGGMELTKAEQAIERGLRVYDRFVRANLIITTLAGHTAAVLGAVQTPGRIEVNPGMRLADLLAEAGGPAVTRDNSQVLTLAGNLDLARLVRDGEPLPVSLQLAMQGDPRHNIRVRAGDQLFVPASLDKLIMVLGDVGAPTPIMFREGIRLSEALARAGGIDTARGDRKDIRIVREEGGSANTLRGTVVAIRPKPTCTEIELDAGVPLVALERRGIEAHELTAGQSVALVVEPRAVKVFSG